MYRSELLFPKFWKKWIFWKSGWFEKVDILKKWIFWTCLYRLEQKSNYDFLADRLLFGHYLDIDPEIIGHNHLFYRNTDKYRTFYLNKIQDQINSNRMGFRNGNIFRLFRLLQFIDRPIFGEKPAVAHLRSICLFAPIWPHLTVRWKAGTNVRNYEKPNIF